MLSESPSEKPTQPGLPVARLGHATLTRAHHLLGQRAPFVASCAEALQNIASRLHGYLGQPIEARGRVGGCVVRPEQLREWCAYALFDLSDAQSSACLEVDLPFLCSVLDAFAAGGTRSQVATRLTRVEEAAFGFLALQVVAALRQEETIRCRLGPGLSRITLDRQVAVERLGKGAQLAVEVELSVGELSGRARLLLPSQPVEAALVCLPAHFRAPGADQTATLAFTLDCARTRLDRQTARALRRGDVILVDGLERRGDGFAGAVRLQGSTFTLHGALDGAAFHHDRASARRSSKEHPPMATPEAAEASLLPVDVEVELCRTRLPLAEVAALRQGALISLRITPTEPVILKLDDRPIARAELVDLDGQLGARVLELLGEVP